MLTDKNIKNKLLIILLPLFALASVASANTLDIINKAKAAYKDQKYEEVIKILAPIDEKELANSSDSCIMLYNYLIGYTLYRQGNFEQPIPYLLKGLEKEEKIVHEDCNYLEMLYTVGCCYKELNQFDKAEEYLRKVIVRGPLLPFKCDIATQALSEMISVYTSLGFPKLADECTKMIASMTSSIDENVLYEHKIDGLFDLTTAYEQQGKIPEAIETYKKIINLAEEKSGKNSEDYVLFSYLLAVKMQLNWGMEEDALAIYKSLIQISRGLNDHYSDIGYSYQNYIHILSYHGDFDQAIGLLPEAIDYINNIQEDKPQENLYETIGIALYESGKYEESMVYLEKEWNGQRVTSVKSLAYLGECYSNKDYNKAMSYLLQAIKTAEQDEGTNDDTKLRLFNDIISVSQNFTDYSTAINYSTIAEPLVKAQNDPDLYVKHLINWSNSHTQIGEYDLANKLLNKASELEKDIQDVTIIRLYGEKGFLKIKKGDYTECIEILQKGISFTISSQGENCSQLPTMYHNLGRAYMLQNDYENAINYLNKAKESQILIFGEPLSKTEAYLKECIEKK